MTFAIISAGEGSRLSQEGINLPKPLVHICGEPMIDRLVRIFMQNGAERIVIIINDLYPQTKAHLQELKQRTTVPMDIIVKNTPSSMHSFHALMPYIKTDKFCLTTVDTIFHENEFADFIASFRKAETDGCMAVTPFVDDEKPLYVATDEALRITGFHDAPTPQCAYVSGGIYGLTSKSFATLSRCIEEGMSRMRNFQRQLIADGLHLQAYPFHKIVDVDHAGDIAKAEAFLKNEPKPHELS